jgi:hypothetical protein
MDLAFAWSVVGLNRRRGRIYNFVGAPMISNANSVFLAVNASTRWLNNVGGAYLVQVSLLISQRGLGHFFR